MDAKIITSPVRPALISMTAPAAFGMLMTFMFQLIDTYFVGKLGTQELAAMSFSYPVYILVVSFFMGAAAGVSSSVAKVLGEKQWVKAKQLTTLAIVAFVFLTVLLSIIGLSVMDALFFALGVTEVMLPLVKQYMEPLFIGMFALVAGLIGNAALMAKGIMIRSTLVMGIGGIVNVVFDYVLIFGFGPFPAMGLAGAAYATVLSWAVIFLLMMTMLVRESLLSLSFFMDIRQAIKDLRGMLYVAMPAIAAQLLNPVAIAVITRIVSGYGEDAVAAFGIVTRIESLILVGILSLSVVMTPFVAQNFGAKHWHRLDKIVAHAGRLTVYWGIAAFTIVALFPQTIMTLFTQSDAVVAQGVYYFWTVGLSFPMFGLLLITTSFLNGVQSPRTSLKLTIVKSLGLTIPLALLGSYWSLEGTWVGLSIANVIGAWYAYKVLNRWLSEHGSTLPKRSIVNDYKSDLMFWSSGK
ncbi:MATE family efflux transporter [Vibrio sp. La 4.2.2]|uniref:MATE family efflux transporter n=1 Tax=Vibrio sp. La 4.2.2 TaxID=2998830 RepID=UPI0022CDCC91|nr:MATE family efflux transporter [Vibrio sp. La 4.2.2]MDA0107048.1 MATE family efflux transporter [Vibrio sp. La 4.2.2]